MSSSWETTTYSTESYSEDNKSRANIDPKEKKRIRELLEKYGWKMDRRLGVVDSLSKVMSYVRTGTTENELYYLNRLRDARAELKKENPSAPRRLKEELGAIAFNCNILVALPLVDMDQVDAFLLEKPQGVLPAWLHMSALSTTLTVASFPSASKDTSLYALLKPMEVEEDVEFRQPKLVRRFDGYCAYPTKRKATFKRQTAATKAKAVKSKQTILKKPVETVLMNPTPLPALEIAIAS